ncbi:MAG: hypothetical protein HN590_14135, partial [Calditrichaeota bacterium]|nr:hypothetical protein [Calditrichota bacterium]
MFRISLISLLLLMSVGRIYAQPEVEWQRFYGIDCPDEFNSHIRTEDDGWAFTGYRMPDIINFLYLVKTDPEGQLEFESTYGEGEAGWTGHDLSQTEDGGYLIGGNWDSNRGYGFGALRTDPNGNLMWQRTYGDFDRSLCYAVIGSSNNEFYLAGFARTEESGNQGYIVKISANGDIIWEQLYGGNGTEEFRDITATNIGYVLCGSSSSVGGDDKDFWFVRINSDGEELQSETYGNELDETAYAIKAYPNQAGWMLSGERGPGWPDFNAALLRINQEGNQQWLTEYEHDDLNTHAYDCVIGPDEGITAVGYGNGRNIHLAYCFGTDNAGNLEWGRMHNLDDGGAIFQSAVLDDDGGVTIAGTVDIREGRFVNDQGWFLKLAAADLPP